MKKIALRIDVDTFRGTRHGVPVLLDLFARHEITGTFYFSVGPDNMGRHLWRLLKPAFLWKMLRTNAASLYGPEILLMGTFWPGPAIGKGNSDVIKAAAQAGHEMGLHTWDHHQWQSKIDRMTPEQLFESLRKGVDTLGEITGEAPATSAVPGWKCTDQVLLEKAKFPFKYNSDCRGQSVFMPRVNGQLLSQPQVPVTMPTYDEALGRDGINNSNYNDHMLTLLKEDQLNVLTIHAEAEGNICRDMFDEYVRKAKDMGYEFTMLKDAIPAETSVIPPGRIDNRAFPGREGWISCQAE
jgi:undecaprenyl phosphate-alpha-L-ara4FN deformylase